MCTVWYMCSIVQAEWQLLFHFVLHYPTIVSEAVRIRSGIQNKSDEDPKMASVAPLVGVDISVNKVHTRI